ncbi:N-carbamoylputrescine amidase [Gellertiella hungarica]|uniref:N-carbamoylputrescine amidase n=1 Tax=Gellertiella hungarica TaxID=1572859 RepID=A0A7W6JB61_9HYPH|nr:N-carbamoylputrescine amidase [Gellertiella hungarica]MBB4067232.1 N-carbamoylputrescine amidase [Gellertiella hungarica]
MRKIGVAATQMACSWDRDENIQKAEALVRRAHGQGADIVLLQELFQTPYFCQEQTPAHLGLANPLDEDRGVSHFRAIARELGVVLPVSYYERSGMALFNSLAIIDADGSILFNYRKSHIPQGPGYEEKFYFSPGDTGCRAVRTRHATIGCGICWDQWFPEGARAMALQGAELLFYPTAIGSEPHDPTIDSARHWQRTMQGHAGANVMPVIASNRIGVEVEGKTTCTFYGSSFIADHTGALVAEANRTDETVLVHAFDLDAIGEYRRAWGLFRDRRPDLYGVLRTLDGSHGIGQ